MLICCVDLYTARDQSALARLTGGLGAKLGTLFWWTRAVTTGAFRCPARSESQTTRDSQSARPTCADFWMDESIQHWGARLPVSIGPDGGPCHMPVRSTTSVVRGCSTSTRIGITSRIQTRVSCASIRRFYSITQGRWIACFVSTTTSGLRRALVHYWFSIIFRKEDRQHAGLFFFWACHC